MIVEPFFRLYECRYMVLLARPVQTGVAGKAGTVSERREGTCRIGWYYYRQGDLWGTATGKRPFHPDGELSYGG